MDKFRPEKAFLQGKLLRYHEENIDIQTEEGELQTIDRKAITKVQYGEDNEAERQRKVRLYFL